MQTVHPVLLAGGSGTRLWPVSRKTYPKQFSKFLDDKTLFQQSALRLISSKHVKFAQHITLTNSDFRFIISEQLLGVGIDPKHILIEPEAKNTAGAILAASIFSQSIEENAILLVAPSDHVIPDTNEFHKAISVGISHVKNGKIVTFGIQPTHPETGYGYLELSGDRLDQYGSALVSKFIEKPNLANVKQMLKVGNFLWNSGIFLFSAKDMISAFEIYSPETLKLVQQAVKLGVIDLGFLRLSSKPWSKIENISIDFAIMEKAENLVAVPYSSKWSDLGSWNAVWAEGVHDASGNVTSKRAHAFDCSGSLLRSESDSLQVIGLGLEEIIAIAMPDAVLVANKNRVQEVKKVVDFLKVNNVPQAEIFPKEHRPWGWFESIALGDRFQVKRIFVKPGAALSLQSHTYRSEHWIVVEGKAWITIDGASRVVNEGESTFVPTGAIHRLENLDKRPMLLIEVQIGNYLGEDDIVRYEDAYARV